MANIKAGTKQGMLFLGNATAAKPGVRFEGLTEVDEEWDGGDIKTYAADDQADWFTVVEDATLTPTIKTYVGDDETLLTATGFTSLTSAVGAAKAKTGQSVPVSLAYKTTLTDNDTHNSKPEIRILYNLLIKAPEQDLTVGPNEPVEFSYEATASSVKFVDVDGNEASTPLVVISPDDPNWAYFNTTLFGTGADATGAELVTPQDYVDYSNKPTVPAAG